MCLSMNGLLSSVEMPNTLLVALVHALQWTEMGTEAPKTKQFTEEIHSYFSSSALSSYNLKMTILYRHMLRSTNESQAYFRRDNVAA